jgi:predicted double-glycine peptidase
MLNIKPFRERTNYCGPASLKMVLDYFGIKKSENELARMMGCVETLGVEAGIMIQTANKLGLAGFVKDDATFGDIRKYVLDDQIPVIVDWFSEDDGHYSVVVDIDEENIYLLDPQLGYVRAMTLDKFYRVWFDFPGDYLRSKDDINIRRMIVICKDIASNR